MRTTFIEAADTPAEMRDLIVAWLREEAERAEIFATNFPRKRDAEKSQREAQALRRAADFWSEVVIEPRTGDHSTLARLRRAAGESDNG